MDITCRADRTGVPSSPASGVAPVAVSRSARGLPAAASGRRVRGVPITTTSLPIRRAPRPSPASITSLTSSRTRRASTAPSARVSPACCGTSAASRSLPAWPTRASSPLGGRVRLACGAGTTRPSSRTAASVGGRRCGTSDGRPHSVSEHVMRTVSVSLGTTRPAVPRDVVSTTRVARP